MGTFQSKIPQRDKISKVSWMKHNIPLLNRTYYYSKVHSMGVRILFVIFMFLIAIKNYDIDKVVFLRAIIL